MKKTIFYLSLAVMAMSCVKEQNPGALAPEKTLSHMEFTATVEVATKTALDQIDEAGATVKWLEGDQVAVFDGSNINAENGNDEGLRFQAQSEGSSVVISGEADAAAAEYYAIYPFSSGHSMSAENVFTTQIKAQQIVSAGSMADDCAVLLAKAEGANLHFKNASALVKFNLSVEGVKSLTLIGNNNEQIAGQFQLTWNEGDPKVNAVTKPAVTVTLRSEADAVLATGDYYFTIIPTSFTKGFSVILGMNDGTQKIIRRSAAVELKRNEIFRTQAAPEAAYKPHVSNFVKYNDGFPLTYSHLTVQKGAEDAYAMYLNNGVNYEVGAGIYFVGQESTSVSTRILACSKVLIAGDTPSVRSKITFTKAFQPTTGATGMIVCADLEITTTLRDFMTQGQNFTEFGNIIFKNCQINALHRHLAEFGSKNMTLDYFVMEDCDVLLDNSEETNTYLLTTNAQSSTIRNIIYKNNTFHQIAATSKLANFRFANCLNTTGSEIENVIVTNNTLNKALLKKHGFVLAATLKGYCEVKDNFFVECHPAGTEIALVKANTYSDTMTYQIKNNFLMLSEPLRVLKCQMVLYLQKQRVQHLSHANQDVRDC